MIFNGGEQECVIGTLQDYQYGFYGIISEVFKVSKEKEINDGFENYWLTFKQPIINYLNVFYFIFILLLNFYTCLLLLIAKVTQKYYNQSIILFNKCFIYAFFHHRIAFILH